MPDALRRMTPRRAGLSLTSLIDVIFLLLLFFMLSSTFSRLGEMELTAARQGSDAPAQPQPPVFVQLTTESLRLNAREIPLEALRSALTDAASADGLVLIALGAGVTAQRLVDVLAQLRDVPFAVQVLT
ncbi:MAG: biopolymer transporter ExbD [Rhodobacter sp.]|nr:biopolymer transporter ExbD [Paracoccaceae bacterium]MCC0076507.1 biopolymer transporter ExbD [Rhodobacter sp.]